MTQISRPFQIALAAVLVLFALWFAVLRGHSSSGESSSSAAAPSAQPATAPQASASSGSSSSPAGSSGSAGSTPTTGSSYHGSAPGVAGLTRAIAKARGAVTQSQQNAKRLQQKSEAVSTSPSGSTQAGSPSKPAPTSAKSAAEAAPSGAGKTHSSAPVTPVKRARAGGVGVPAMQVKVEGQLKQGKVVAILLWNPKSSVDTVVRRELQAAGRTFGGKLAVHVALAPQVGSFGTFTRAVQVYSTPTILIVNPKGVASSVTGLTDAFSIEQAVREAKQAR